MKKPYQYFTVLLLTILFLFSSCNNLQEQQTNAPDSNDQQQESHPPETDNRLSLDNELSSDNHIYDDSSGELLASNENEFIPGEHGQLAMAHILHIQEHFPYRLAFTYHEYYMALWLEETLLAMGFDESSIDTYTFPLEDIGWMRPLWGMELLIAAGDYDDLEKREYSQNITLTLPGISDQVILVVAHYDSVGTHGISDNASGVALLLESIYRLKHIEHYYTLQFAFLGAEEIGLVGAFHFIEALTPAELDAIRLVVNADVLFDGPDLFFSTGYAPADWRENTTSFTRYANVYSNALTAHIEALASDLNYHQQLELIGEPRGIYLPTDQLAFLEFGIPVLVFAGMHSVPYPTLMEWDVLHTPDDNFYFLNENFPGRMERSLYTFGIFLEAVLSMNGVY